MRIVYIEEAWVPSTAAYSVHTLHTVSAMAELGHEVTLLAPMHDGAARTREAQDAMRRDLALRGPFQLRYLPYVDRPERLRYGYFTLAPLLAFAARADLVFTRNSRIAQLATLAGLRVLIEWHDPPKTPRSLKTARGLVDNDYVVRWVFVSERLRQIMRADMPIRGERCVVAHNGVAYELFADLPPATEARRQLGLRVDAPTVVHSGHMYAGRGIDLLLEVAAAMPETQLVLVGGAAEDVTAVRAEVAQRGLGNVHVAGHRPVAEVPRYLAAGDVLVMSYTSATVTSDRKTRSIEFASPMKAFEYMAAGRPIVATRFPGVCEVLVDDRNAFLVEPDSAAELRRGIEAVLADPARARRVAAQAKADAQERTWRRRTEKILAGLD
jgi:glycosyltransferase involved in cell wall biosynthesis